MKLICLVLILSLICTCLPISSIAETRADIEFDSASISLYTSKQAYFRCQTYATMDNLSVTSCWLQQQVNGVWTYVCSLTRPSTVGVNTGVYAALMDYSSIIGSGTYRIGARFNADGHTIVRYSNSRTF